MRITNKQRIERFVNMAKAISAQPKMTIRTAMRFHPNDDHRCTASVWVVDGKAIIVPSTLRCGILIVDWFALTRYLRRHSPGRQLFLRSSVAHKAATPGGWF